MISCVAIKSWFLQEIQRLTNAGYYSIHEVIHIQFTSLVHMRFLGFQWQGPLVLGVYTVSQEICQEARPGLDLEAYQVTFFYCCLLPSFTLPSERPEWRVMHADLLCQKGCETYSDP